MSSLRPRHGAAGAVVALLLACCLAGCAPAPPAPGVLLVTLDTTRADHLGCYGDPRGLTPRIDAWAARGLIFDAARAPTPVTLPSHATLLTGLQPGAHGVHANGSMRLGDDALLLSEALAGEGFRTAGFVGSWVLDARFGLAQGFERYSSPSAGALGASTEIVERPADAVIDEALAWLSGLERDEPFLLWVHLFDPHQPLQAPARLLERIGDGYAAEIAFCDEQLGRLLGALDASGRARNLVSVITADHGEGLGEHGEATHGYLLHDATLRVPLLLAAPGLSARAGARVAADVSLADVPSTVLALLGLPARLLPEALGPDLLQSAGLAPASLPVGSERVIPLSTRVPWESHRWQPLTGVVWQRHKLVAGARDEVFDLAADPGELSDLSAEDAERSAALKRAAQAVFAESSSLAESRALTLEEAAALSALGYVGAASAADAPDVPRDAPDPRDRLDDLRALDEAVAQMSRARRLLGLDANAPASPGAESLREAFELLDRARVALQRLHAAHDDDPIVLANLGLLALSEGRPEQAAPFFERHLEADPASVPSHVNLALCRATLGEVDAARRLMWAALQLQSDYALPRAWLVDQAIAAGEFGEAVWWLEQDPNPDAQRLGQLRARMRASGQTVRRPDFTR